MAGCGAGKLFRVLPGQGRSRVERDRGAGLKVYDNREAAIANPRLKGN